MKQTFKVARIIIITEVMDIIEGLADQSRKETRLEEDREA
jgi:hypothetical protein